MSNKIVAHTSFLGHTGYANHSRNFFTHLNKHIPVKVRNFTYDDDQSYLSQEQRDMIYYNTYHDEPPFNKHINDMNGINIVLNETNHYYFYHNYRGPKIAYNVWESTRQPEHFFNRLLEYDMLFVPSGWQRQCSIEQGYPEDRVKVVPEGVDGNLFYPKYDENERRKLLNKYNIPTDAFVFMIFGRWDYRKSIMEMIKGFTETFGNHEKIYLVASVDNPFPVDGMNSTEERMNHYGFERDNIRILHFPPNEEYIKWLQLGDVYLSCSRSEGWGLPLIESIACGCVSVCSDWGAQLEFADGISHKVRIKEMKKPENVFMTSNDVPGLWSEPDFEHFKDVMVDCYENHEKYKKKALKDSERVREKFSWENAAKKAKEYIDELSPLQDVDIKGRKMEFTWNGNKTKTEARIFEKYTKLNFYKCDLNLKNGIRYFFEHAPCIGNDVEKTFCITENGKVLFENSINGIYDISDMDKEGHLKDYNTSDSAAGVPLYEIFISKVYENDQCKIEENDTVVDIGSNIGLFSVYAYYKGCRKCYAFEPIKHIFESSKKQLKDIPNLEIENKAISNFTGETKIYVPKNDTIGSKLNDIWNNDNVRDIETCKVISFMDMIKEKELKKIDFLKLDCEGSEYEIIESIPDEYLKNNIHKMAIEYHDNFHREVEGIIRKLRYNGFKTEIRSNNSLDDRFGILYAWKESDMELYQDQYINGNIIKKGKVDNSSRYEVLKTLFEKYKRPFTVLDIGANFGYYSIRAATEYDAYSVMIEGQKDESNKLIELCKMNDCRDKLTVLNTKMDLYKLEELSKCEHFDVVLALNVLHHFDNNQIQEICKVIMNLGDNVIIETPSSDDKGACGHGNLEIVNEYYKDITKTELGEFSRHTSETSKSKMFWLETPKSRIKYPYYGYERLFKNKNLDVDRLKKHQETIIDSTFNNKSIKTRHRDYYTEWIPGINLKTYVELNGIFPSKKDIIEKLENRDIESEYEWDGTNNDLVIHNFILKGSQLYLIDFDDSNIIDNILLNDDLYMNLIIKELKQDNYEIKHNFINGPFVEILSSSDMEFLVQFIDDDRSEIIHQGVIRSNHWIEANRKYYTNWKILVKKNNIKHIIHQDLKDKNVLISFESRSLGDTLAWMPYIEKFREKHQCKIFVSTFWNNLFDYPNLNFIMPGYVVQNIYARYEIGCFKNNENKNPHAWMDTPIQKIASDILGLEYKEIRPKIKIGIPNYVAISEHSTAKCKYWNYESGWQKIVDYINNKTNMKPMVISKEKTKLKNVKNMTNKNIMETIENLRQCKLLITLSTGLAWLAWSLKIPVIMISGCTQEWNEFECERIINKNVCHGCMNNSKYIFDRGNWEWCPEKKNFECTREIYPQDVIKILKKYK